MHDKCSEMKLEFGFPIRPPIHVPPTLPFGRHAFTMPQMV